MKKFLSFFTVVAAMATMLLSVSCLAVKEDQTEAEFQIEGKWKMILGNDDHLRNFDIQEDGTCRVTEIEDGFAGDSGEYKWSYNEDDGVLVITNDDDEVEYKYTIADISKNAKSCQWIDLNSGAKKAYDVKRVD